MQITTKFTPGPWSISTESTVCKQIDAEHHAICTDQFCFAPADEKAANAALIAAAPELYEALVEMLAASQPQRSDQPGFVYIGEAQEKATVALAKARGEVV